MNIRRLAIVLVMFIGSQAAMADWTCNIGIWNGEGDTELLARDNLQANCIVGSVNNSQGCVIMAEGANCQEQFGALDKHIQRFTADASLNKQFWGSFL